MITVFPIMCWNHCGLFTLYYIASWTHCLGASLFYNLQSTFSAANAMHQSGIGPK